MVAEVPEVAGDQVLLHQTLLHRIASTGLHLQQVLEEALAKTLTEYLRRPPGLTLGVPARQGSLRVQPPHIHPLNCLICPRRVVHRLLHKVHPYLLLFPHLLLEQWDFPDSLRHRRQMGTMDCYPAQNKNHRSTLPLRHVVQVTANYHQL